MNLRVTTISAFALVAVLLVLAHSIAAQAVRSRGDWALLANLPDHAPLDRILAQVVRDERVDYDLIAGRYQDALLTYLIRLSRVDTAHLPRNELLAYYLNLYNGAMIWQVTEHRRADPDWRPDKDDFAVFKMTTVWIGNRQMSLNELEHDIIRPQFKDPRIHAALVCAAESCPPLLPRAYHAEDLDEVLDENMKRFVADRTRNPIDDETKQLRLSKIFEWYAEDFGGRDKLADYVGRYAGKDYGDYTISFVEYSWALNDVTREAAGK